MNDSVTSIARPRRSLERFQRSPSESTYSARDLLWIGLERWRLFLLVTGLIAVPSAWFILSLPSTYTASATVLIEPNERMKVNVDSAVAGLMLDNESVRSEVEVLRSTDLVRPVLDRLRDRITRDLKPETTGLFAVVARLRSVFGQQTNKPTTESEFVSLFLKRMSVTPIEKSRVIQVSYRSYNSLLAAEVANDLARRYVDRAIELKRSGTREAAAWLDNRMVELKASIDASERAIEEYRQRNGLVQGDGSQTIAERLTQANLALSRSRVAAAEAMSRLVHADENDPASDVREVLSSPLIQRLRQMEAELATRVDEFATSMPSTTPSLVAAKNALARVRLSIAAEIRRIQDDLRHEAESAQALQNSLQQEVDSLLQRMSAMRTASIGLRALERDAEASRAIYENILLRTKDVLAQESFLQRDARIIGHAIAPAHPSNVSPTLLVVAAVVAGAVVAMCAIRLLIHLEPGYRRVSDIENATNTEVLACVPETSLGRSPEMDQELLEGQRSRFAASIDMLLGRLVSLKPEGRGMVVTITSCVAGEGKTTLALALAHLAARGGYRCLLIDGDFQSPAISRLSGLEGHSGFLDTLEEGAEFEDLLIRTRLDIYSLGAAGLESFRVAPAGRIRADMRRLLRGETCRRLVRELTQEFEIVIIDSSALAVATEAEILAEIADQTLMVVRWRRTPRAMIDDAVARMADISQALSGIVLSQVRISPGLHKVRYGV